MENIGLQDSLLSRFDLLFVMLDTVDNDNDQRIADFVVRMHRYRNPKEQDGQVLPMGGNYAEFLTTFNLQTEDESSKEMQIFEKYDALLHGESRTRSEQILSVQFMRKYIHLAKCLKPRLTQEASDVIANEYSRLRSQDHEVDAQMARTQPVTARTLETLIRLATAHAKARMAKTISVADAKAAIELVQFAYFKKVLEKEKRKRRRSEDGGSDMDDDDMGGDDDNVSQQPSQGTRKSKRTKTTDASEAMDVEEMDDDTTMHVEPVDAGDLTKRTTRKSVGRPSQQTATTESAPSPDFISQDRLSVFKQKLNQAFRDVRDQTLAVEALTSAINQSIAEPFSQAEVNAAIELMSDANQIMVADGIVFLI